MLVIDHQVPQTKSSNSKELEPAAHHLYRVKEAQPKNLRLVSVIDGTERSLPYEIVKPISTIYIETHILIGYSKIINS